MAINSNQLLILSKESFLSLCLKKITIELLLLLKTPVFCWQPVVLRETTRLFKLVFSSLRTKMIQFPSVLQQSNNSLLKLPRMVLLDRHLSETSKLWLLLTIELLLNLLQLLSRPKIWVMWLAILLKLLLRFQKKFLKTKKLFTFKIFSYTENAELLLINLEMLVLSTLSMSFSRLTTLKWDKQELLLLEISPWVTQLSSLPRFCHKCKLLPKLSKSRCSWSPWKKSSSTIQIAWTKLNSINWWSNI